MSLETGTRIADLVATNPVGATDFASQGDDHIRLIKACLQGSFPSLGATAVTATAEELNGLHALTASKAVATNSSGIAVASSTSDAELAGLHALTASRAVVTTAGGILVASAVTAAELGYVSGVTSAIQTQLGALSSSITGLSSVYQPLDSDLTALAALTTASYGRDFNTLANDAALATKIAAIVPTWTGAHTFSATVAINPASGNGVSINIAALGSTTVAGIKVSASASNIAGIILQSSGKGSWQGYAAGAADEYRIFGATLNSDAFTIDSTGVVKVYDAGTMREVGYRFLPLVVNGSSSVTLAQTMNGKSLYHNNAGAVTTSVPQLTAETVITMINDTGANMAVNQSTTTISWFSGASKTTGNRTLANGGVMTLWWLNASSVLVWGSGIS